ncbi:MAG: iron-containing alcohol dehydrogenase [candidate division WS1 bacterium]|jgi:alcohol dehydrogenase class IV|nr:iron-containing alcohol dehydrogenase [candidate division WS1 bacterium]
MAEITLRSAKEIIFGSGSRVEVGAQAALLGNHALIVCGQGSLQASGALDELRAHLEEAGVTVTVFAEVEAEPSLDTVERGREAFSAGGCDMVVAAGGGSALDVGKAIAALAPLPEPLSDFFAGAMIPGQGRPCIALPTTSGTGAEVTPNSVLTDTATGTKASIRGHALLPEIALVDPELTLSLPPDQTAFSGLDALTQAIEAYVSTGANPVSAPMSEEAVRRIAGSLRQAVQDGRNLQAREDMALGSLLAGLALASARLGLVHGLAHPLGSLYHLPHGMVCGALLPWVIEFNLPAAEGKYARLAQMAGVGESAEDLLEWVDGLVEDLGAGVDFTARGLKRDDFDRIVPYTVASGSSKHNPRPVDEQGVTELLGRLIE